MQRKDRVRRLLFRLLLLSALSWLVRTIRRTDEEWEYPDSSTRWEPSEPDSIGSEPLESDERERTRTSRSRRPFSARRVATSLSFAVLFFAGAAFTAGAGDRAARLLEEEDTCSTLQAYDAASAEQSATDESQACFEEDTAAATEPSDDAAGSESGASAAPALDSLVPAQQPAAPATESPQSADSQSGAEASSQASGRASQPAAQPSIKVERRLSPSQRPIKARGTHRWVVKRARTAPANPPEIEDPNAAATVWLNRALPDPTPPARRLAPRFARNLARVARQERVSWAYLLAVLRVQGDRSAVPATVKELRVLAQRLRTERVNRDAWAAALALSGRTGFADRTMALTHYHRAVGLRALVTGLKKAKPFLTKRLLDDKRVSVYAGGREDLRAGRIDVRVVVLLRYLAESFDQVTVSSLFSGHRKFSRPGVISAHTYGHAVDVSGLAGTTIFGHQQPGGLTETAVRAILLLPSEVQPQQVISLLGLGGASFPMADHGDHIHVGY